MRHVRTRERGTLGRYVRKAREGDTWERNVRKLVREAREGGT